tara:strand:- start:68 stop:625 length:558 start_codon:yes stop_codon:yes gene_type:complete
MAFKMKGFPYQKNVRTGLRYKSGFKHNVNAEGHGHIDDPNAAAPTDATTSDVTSGTTGEISETEKYMSRDNKAAIDKYNKMLNENWHDRDKNKWRAAISLIVDYGIDWKDVNKYINLEGRTQGFGSMTIPGTNERVYNFLDENTSDAYKTARNHPDFVNNEGNEEENNPSPVNYRSRLKYKYRRR